MGDPGGAHPKTPLPVVVVVVALWYCANILMVMSNKYLLSHSGFERPVFLTLCHMVVCVLLAFAANTVLPLKPIKSRQQFGKVALLAGIFCATILLGNASLQYLPVSFNQMIGATTPVFTAILAFTIKGTRESVMTYMALLPVVSGVVVATGGEPAFHLWGFLFCLAATAGRALKSVVQEMLMKEGEKLDPMSLLVYMSAVCSIMLLPLVWIMEPTAWSEAVQIYSQNRNFLWWMTTNAVVAYVTNLLNFQVTRVTDALTQQVLGNAKGVVAAIVSVAVFKNVVTVQGAMGYAITVGGVFLYSEAKRRFKRGVGDSLTVITAKDALRLAASGKHVDTEMLIALHAANSNGVGNHEESHPLLGTAIATPTSTRKAHPGFRDAV